MKVNVNGLSKYYGDFCAVNNISFSFESGKIFSIIGQNGSGKTSTIRMMLGTMGKNSGSVDVDGVSIEKYIDKIGYLPEERGLYIKDTVERQVLYFASLKGMNLKNAKQSLDYWLDYMNLSKYKKSKIETLSKGNQQKIQLLASIIHNPDIIILDEPFSGLDPVNSQLLIKLLEKLKKENKCIMVSSHQLNFIEQVCDKILIISKSNAIYYGDVKILKDKYKKDYMLIKTNCDLCNYDNLGAKKSSDNEYKIYFADNKEQMKKLSFILNQNIVIDSLETERVSLHDIFVENMGEL